MESRLQAVPQSRLKPGLQRLRQGKILFCLVVNKIDVSRILRMGTWCAPEYAGERLVPGSWEWRLIAAYHLEA